jgi:hypothetical protein
MTKEIPDPKEENGLLRNTPILTLNLYGKDSYRGVTINEYLEKVRYKYWEAIFRNEKLISGLTSEMLNTYRLKLD